MLYEDFYLSRDSEFSYVISSVFSVGVGGWRGERGGGGREAVGGGRGGGGGQAILIDIVSTH